MRSMQMVLATTDRRKIDNGPLSESLNELQDVLFDAEDVMDELDYYQLQQQIEGKGSRASACIDPEGSCVSSYTPSLFQQVSSGMNQIIGWAMHGRKRKREEEPTHSIILPLEIKHDISDRIKGILNQLRIKGKPVLEILQLELSCQIAMSKQIQSEPRKPRQTTSLLIERKVYGRDAERDNIIELLTKGKSSDLGVLPLVGVGGVGKTTLARFVYHDQRIKDHFDLRMWVCVSDNFNEKSLTREILEHVCKDRQGYENISKHGPIFSH
ncbi:disease resistance protein RGA2-like [Oryza glaberrima]|uniref:disease resistance protein RGA2-like n=1 Tax=Oryza glaberrima TaxID=4538 RepID=UPI00224C5392|nr:disease resistance protein RGA2-like [Oryza glaberrima]